MTQDNTTGFYVPELSSEDQREMRRLEESGGLPKEINRSIDVFFRYLLGSPARKHLLMDLLNSLFSFLGYPMIQQVELINTELPPGSDLLKHSRLDIRALDELGRILNIELQNAIHRYLISRCLYYLAKMYIEPLGSGEEYHKLPPVLMIGLLGFDMFGDPARAVWDFTWMNPATHRLLTPEKTIQALFFVEMKKIRKNLNALGQRVKQPGYVLTDEDRLSVWGSYFTNDMTGVNLMQTALAKDKVFGEVNEAEKEYWGSSTYRYLQLRAQLAEMDRKAFEEEAREAGFNQGFNQGREEGCEEGCARTLDAAIVFMRENGIPMELISKFKSSFPVNGQM